MGLIFFGVGFDECDKLGYCWGVVNFYEFLGEVYWGFFVVFFYDVGCGVSLFFLLKIYWFFIRLLWLGVIKFLYNLWIEVIIVVFYFVVFWRGKIVNIVVVIE